MASVKAPKQWCLTKNENVNSIEVWKDNLIFILSEDPKFAELLKPGTIWQKKSKSSPNRGFTNTSGGETAQQKVVVLERMLGQIANYCPVISRNSIVKNSTYIDSIWQSIRLHFGLQSTGGHFLDFADIKMEPGEKPEDLYQRLVSFVEDNFLEAGGNITHHGEKCTDDEELTPMVENIIVLTWLRLAPLGKATLLHGIKITYAGLY